MKKTALKSFIPAPSKDRYFARLFNKGLVTYYTEGPGGRPQALPNDVLSYYDQVQRDGKFESGLAGDEWSIRPELRPLAEKLVSLGLFEVKERAVPYADTAFQYRKPWPPASEWKSSADVPKTTLSYGPANYSPWENTILVDTANRTISLDASWTLNMSRRPNMKPDGGGGSHSYVIPSGDVAFDMNRGGLTKILKHVLSKDPRVDLDYEIVGDERLRGKKIRNLLGEAPLSGLAVGNIPKGQSSALIAYHGTSTNRWKEISSRGMRPGVRDESYADLIPGYSNKNVYLTFSVSEAENYATRESIWNGGSPLVIRVEIPDPTKIVADEDYFAWVSLPRTYMLTDLKGRSVEFKELHSKDWLLQLRERYVQDAEFLSLEAIVQKYIRDIALRELKKGGSVAYRGIIPPKFISKFREYPKKKFQTSESKGLEIEEYQQTRREVQDKMKRFDASPARVAARFLRS